MDLPRRDRPSVPPVDSDGGSEGSIAQPGEGEPAEGHGRSKRDDEDRQSGGSEGS